MDNNLTMSLCKVLTCFWNNYKESEIKKISDEDVTILEKNIEAIFAFSVIWSLCCTCVYDSR